MAFVVLRSSGVADPICALRLGDIAGGLRGYADQEAGRPPDQSARHMHIFLRRTSLYRVAWETRGGRRFVTVKTGDEGGERFVSDIERWVYRDFEELNDAHDKAVKGKPFNKVKWSE